MIINIPVWGPIASYHREKWGKKTDEFEVCLLLYRRVDLWKEDENKEANNNRRSS